MSALLAVSADGAPEKLAGKRVKCKKCGTLLAVPEIADNADLVPLDDPLHSLFDQELPPPDVTMGAGRPWPAPQTPGRTRPVGPDLSAAVLSLFRPLPALIRRAPVRVACVVLLLCGLVGASLREMMATRQGGRAAVARQPWPAVVGRPPALPADPKPALAAPAAASRRLGPTSKPGEMGRRGAGPTGRRAHPAAPIAPAGATADKVGR